MARDAIIDDTDESVISYFGNWNHSAQPLNFASPEYNNTFHSTNDPNASAVITVQGASHIMVFGTVDQPASKGLPTSTWTLDGASPSPIVGGKGLEDVLRNRTDTISHVEIWSIPKIPLGTHTLVVNVTGVANGPTFYLDFIVAQIDNAFDVENVVVNNDNSNWINAGWTNGTSPSAYEQDVSVPPDEGGRAILGFHGTEIAVMGNIDTTTPGDTAIAFVQIDNGTVQTIHASDIPTMSPTATAPGATPTSPPLYQNVEIFKTTGLRDQTTKQHTLTISAPPHVASVWALDYVIYGPSHGSGSSTATASSGSSSSASSSSSSVSHSSSKAAAIGGAVGGVVGLLVIIGAIWLFYRRSKQRREEESRAVSPYTLKNTVNSSNRSFNREGDNRGRQPYQEQDGGVRLAIGEEDDDIDTPQSALPPVYAAY